MLDTQTLKYAGALSLGAATGIAISKYFRNAPETGKEKFKNVPKKWIRVGEVSKFTMYPVKSCKGIDVTEVDATAVGMKVTNYLRDRIFLVVNSESTFQTQRTLPKMCLIGVAIQGNKLTLNAPDKPSITITIPEYKKELVRSCQIFADTVQSALDCGNEIGQWLSDFLEVEGLRLYLHQGETTQREMVALQHKFPTFMPQDKGAFHDQTSYMMIAENSLDKLNAHLEKPVSMKNFRPSIEIRGTPDAFSEELWTYVRIGEDDGPVFKMAKPCTRCKLTTVDPETGEFLDSGEPIKTLLKLKRPLGDERLDTLCNSMGVLGNQMGLLKAGRSIRVGDPIYAAVL